MATANAATNYLERRLLHFLFKNNSLSFSSPGDSIYVGLATAVSAAETGSVTEATFTNYARQQVTAANWTLVGSDSTDQQTATNAANIEFPASGGTNNTITHIIIADAASSGNILFVGALDVQKVIESGDIFRINAGKPHNRVEVMALVISDRIKETTNTVGTQTFQLEGAVTGFETFATNLSDGDTTYYAVTDNTNFEVGLGTINEGTSQTINYTVTVVNDGGNKFALNGVTNPVITFVKGFTYVFDVSDNTNGSHPLRFRTSADASYTDGVSVSGTQGQANATVTIVVASDAPSTLKYYCTVHGNAMGNTINVISAVATLARTTILASSNSNNAVSFGSGTKTIFCTLPAGKAVIKDASGNVGIGTSPQVPLDVNEQIRSKDGSVDLRLLPIDASNAGIIGTYSNDALVINTNSAERIRIDTSGNVGIGTTTPSAPLDVSGDAEITGTLTAGEVSATTLDIGEHKHNRTKYSRWRNCYDCNRNKQIRWRNCNDYRT